MNLLEKKMSDLENFRTISNLAQKDFTILFHDDDIMHPDYFSYAIDFEMMWLKYKQDSYNNILTEDNKRFVMLEKLSTKILEEISCANK